MEQMGVGGRDRAAAQAVGLGPQRSEKVFGFMLEKDAVMVETDGVLCGRK